MRDTTTKCHTVAPSPFLKRHLTADRQLELEASKANRAINSVAACNGAYPREPLEVHH